MRRYETIERELVEMLSKSFTFNDLEALGKDIFGRKYDTHKLEGLTQRVSISPTTAAKRMVSECAENNKLETLALMLIQLDGNYLNDKIVRVFNLESFLYHQAQAGFIYNYKSRKFIQMSEDRSLMANWGSLKDGKEYTLTVASVDIAGNSKLVEKYGAPLMESVYNRLWEHIRDVLRTYDGRVWSWQGDGGLLAFPRDQDSNLSVLCCMNILLSMPVFNLRPENPIKQDIVLRIALDKGLIKFFSDTGRIVSKVINYAAHLEKLHTKSWGISVSDAIHKELSTQLKRVFADKEKFEDRFAYSRIIDCQDLKIAR